MNTGAMAMVFGVVFLLVGMIGFFPAPPPPGAPPLAVEHGHGLALGLFPSARGYFQLVAVSYVLLTVLGLIPMTQTTFGLVPIWGNDIWLHALIAAGAAYFGYFAPARVEAPRHA